MLRAAVCNERRRDDRLAEGGRGGEHAVVMGDESIEGFQLRPAQFALEANACGKRHADFALIFQIGNGAIAFDEIDRVVEAAAGQADMLRIELSA